MGFIRALRNSGAVKLVGKSVWAVLEAQIRLIFVGIPLGIGITIGAAAVFNAALRIALM